ncbi:hypothetical protein QAD02_000097 [Eretmocerus hayati]|uniref:Uncharacterized protein n=2 Tax=Eretmocerus hayati TaxID=131215 RepID=A0ACC2NCZ1_9HYME|nr:hypothetical protein QAD02_000092 [Eretmocerus hayati]KAJ8668838.1 hypothetical protein QAD02_000097 [Eretmocerus hayati]
MDGNISMEEDTELRDLVVQTLESNGVLAKVRAELRASVFLTLEEQESVLNPEPFLNKSVKQYLARSEGKLLFSLVREFLEYFGLGYTMSVYDPETYFGKEYNYAGRKKLSEELGISSGEPLLGEILKNTINRALNNSQKDNKLDRTNDTSVNPANATFDVSVPKILQKDCSTVSTDTSDKLDSNSKSDLPLPINVTINKKHDIENAADENCNKSENDLHQSLPSRHENHKNFIGDLSKERSVVLENDTALNNDNSHDMKVVNQATFNKSSNKSITIQQKGHKNQSDQTSKSHNRTSESHNEKIEKPVEPYSQKGKTIYFDEIVIDGLTGKIDDKQQTSVLGELPSLSRTINSSVSDLPPLNGEKANINDLKELMDLAQGVAQLEEDLSSSASCSASEQSPVRILEKSADAPRDGEDQNSCSQELSSNIQTEEIHEISSK